MLGIDRPVLMDRGGKLSYYHYDGPGSVVATTDVFEVVAESYAYGPFGESADGDALGNPYRFTGRRLDAETGLYYYRARYYSATLGRFLQPDPARYIDGLNLYAYVRNDPLNFADPRGLASEPNADERECDAECLSEATRRDQEKFKRLMEEFQKKQEPPSRLPPPLEKFFNWLQYQIFGPTKPPPPQRPSGGIRGDLTPEENFVG